MIFEMGKLISEMCGEVYYVVSFIEWCVEEVGCIVGECINLCFLYKCGLIISELVGIVYVVMFWNFFVGMIICKVVFVLVVGCVMIFKFVEFLFMIVFYFIELWFKVGGLVNIF